MNRLPRNLIIALQILFSAGFIYALLRRTDLDQIGQHLLEADLALIAFSLVTKLAGFTLMAARLERFVSGAGGLTFGESFRAQSVAFVGNNVLPLRLGEALKIGFMARRGLSSLTACVGIAAVERVLDSVFLALFIGAALILFADVIQTTAALYLFMTFAGLAFAGLFFVARFPALAQEIVGRVTLFLGESTSQALTHHAGQFARGVSALASPRLFLSLVVLTAGYWICSALSVYLWILACGISVPWYAAVVVLVFVCLATVLPSAPGFIGTYHYFAALALGIFGVSSELSASFAIVGHAVAIIPFTLALSPLVAKDIISLHRAAPPRVAVAAKRLRKTTEADAPLPSEAGDGLRLG